MQKVFTVDKIRLADQYTIQNEPIASADLMERAARACVDWLLPRTDDYTSYLVFCGPGNNGGDGLAIARLLTERNLKVQVFGLESERYSADYLSNHERLKLYKEVVVHTLVSENDFPKLKQEDVIIDALFGSGLSKPLKGLPAKLVKHLNQMSNIRIAIDIPSGIFSDVSVSEKNAVRFKADYTLSFQFPKLAFFMPENDAFVGDWQVLDIGLSADFIAQTETPYYLLNHQYLQLQLKVRTKYAHKGTYGHGLLIAGSSGKMGAAVLAGKAALRAGAGLVSVHHPKAGMAVIPTAVPELMTSIDADADLFSEVPDLTKYNAIAIGPGLGTHKKTQNAFKLLIQESKVPLIIDADGLNILAENKTWLAFLPANSILTPHVKEFERLTGKADNAFEQLQKLRDFAQKWGVYVILKGAHTRIATPAGQVFFNSTGNPGMATGGSGDVLTGILLGLSAQNYSAINTCLLGVFLHGLAGDLATETKGQYSLISGDIIDYLGEAFLSLMHA